MMWFKFFIFIKLWKDFLHFAQCKVELKKFGYYCVGEGVVKIKIIFVHLWKKVYFQILLKLEKYQFRLNCLYQNQQLNMQLFYYYCYCWCFSLKQLSWRLRRRIYNYTYVIFPSCCCSLSVETLTVNLQLLIVPSMQNEIKKIEKST